MEKVTKQIKAKIISNKKIAPGYYKLNLTIGSVAKKIKPGQFFNIRCSEEMNPLLRRPFSVHRIGNGTTEILYEIIGKATRALSTKEKGEILDVIGPLGNGFNLRNTQYARRTTILVAGGMGVAPLLALAKRMSPRHHVTTSPVIIIGAKTKKEILCEADFKKAGFEVVVTTEDGSKGKKGLATDLLRDNLKPKTHNLQPIIYACGPNPMLKAIAKITASRSIAAFGSFEEHMACGVGSCYGCVIKTKDGYKRVCKDGPIFDLKEIIW